MRKGRTKARPDDKNRGNLLFAFVRTVGAAAATPAAFACAYNRAQRKCDRCGEYYADYYGSNHFYRLLRFKSALDAERLAFLVRAQQQIHKSYHNEYCRNSAYSETAAGKECAELVDAQ